MQRLTSLCIRLLDALPLFYFVAHFTYINVNVLLFLQKGSSMYDVTQFLKSLPPASSDVIYGRPLIITFIFQRFNAPIRFPWRTDSSRCPTSRENTSSDRWQLTIAIRDSFCGGTRRGCAQNMEIGQVKCCRDFFPMTIFPMVIFPMDIFPADKFPITKQKIHFFRQALNYAT